MLEQQFQRPVTHLEHWAMNGSYRRYLSQSLGAIIKSNNGNVIGNPPPYLTQRTHRADSRLVIARQHCRELKPGFYDFLHGAPTTRLIMETVSNQPAVRGSPVFTNSRMVGFESGIAIRFMSFMSGDKCNPPMAVTHEMSKCQVNTPLIVSNNC